MAQGQSTL